MQSQPAEGPTRVGGEPRPIAVVANHRMTGFREMDANLVAASRFEPNADERGVGPAAFNREVRHRVLALFLFVIGGIPSQRPVRRQTARPSSLFGGDSARHQRGVETLRLVNA